jgi:hypothetical protein
MQKIGQTESQIPNAPLPGTKNISSRVQRSQCYKTIMYIAPLTQNL